MQLLLIIDKGSNAIKEIAAKLETGGEALFTL